MKDDRVEFVNFIFVMTFIFVASIMLFVLIGVFDAKITGFAASSDADVGFEIAGGVNDSANVSMNALANGSFDDSGGVPYEDANLDLDDFVYGNGTIDADGNYVGADEEARIDFLLWGLIIGGMIIFVVIVIIVVVVILKRKKKDVVSNTKEKKSAVPDIPVKVATPVSKSAAAVSPVINKSTAVAKKSVVTPAVLNSKVAPKTAQPAKSVATISSLESIKNYSISFSKDPKERIRYFLNNGNQFVARKDFAGAKQLYSWINNEYKRISRHDDLLYREILDFERSLA